MLGIKNARWEGGKCSYKSAIRGVPVGIELFSIFALVKDTESYKDD